MVKVSIRKPISKSLRFEVFKRDKFKCQYCGACAPEVLLNVDHIKPVAGGGENDIANLITSCHPCNSGKSDKPLSANAMVDKSRRQLEELQDRRDQLELMLEWQQGLVGLAADTTDAAARFFNSFLIGKILSDEGKKPIKKALLRFSFAEVCEAIKAAIDSYHKIGDDGSSSAEGISAALGKITAICMVNRTCAERPYMRRLYHLKNIASRRINYFDAAICLRLLEDAYLLGASDDALYSTVAGNYSWNKLESSLERLISDLQVKGGR